ncbi:MAG: hypothetical protein KGS49_06145 [Planctomycetes bacterium]|nr:hypothetical protein [Planctomycetota bacterium]
MGWMNEIFFARGAWAPLAILLWSLFTLFGWLSYRGTASWQVKSLGTLLRALGIGILCFCLLEPIRNTKVPKSQANSIAVLVDNSRSMRALYDDARSSDDTQNQSGQMPESLPLLERFSGVIADDANWLLKLGEQYRIRKYLFAGQLESADDFASWDGSQYESNIEGALDSVRTRSPSQPPSAIVLISDGKSTNRNAMSQSLTKQDGSAIPIYPVWIPPQGDLRRDLWIKDVSVQTSDFETAPVSISVSLGHRGFSSENIEVRLEDLKHTTLETQTIQITENTKAPLVRFQFRPKESGSQGYKVVCRPMRDLPGLEMTLENNHRYVAIDRAMGPYRILYLSGRPNWEYKFLQRALSEDAEISLTALVRIAKKQPKFSFRAKGNEDTNPLFSGFEDISEEEKEKYDQPVFARLGIVGKDELTQGFPKDAQELFAYSMIILDDLETEFFTVDQLQLLRQFLSQRGGTLLVLGGQESMRGRAFRDSALGQLLPVYGDPTEADLIIPGIEQQVEDPVRLKLSREGWLVPFLRLHDNQADESTRLERMPAFQVWNSTSQIKVGARVLIEGELPDGNKLPMLVVQKFGKGTSGALLVGDLWRWALADRQELISPFYQGWRQLIRGLMVDIPKRVQMDGRVDKGQNSKRKIEIQVLDDKFSSMDNALVEVQITPPKSEVMVVKAMASLDKAGLYETSFLMRDSGVYRVIGQARAPDGTLIGEAQLAFVHEPEALELADCSLDENALKSMALPSGGELVPYRELDSLVDKIPVDQLRYTQNRMVPIWHTPWLLGLSVGCLAIEWWWRRRHGMA